LIWKGRRYGGAGRGLGARKWNRSTQLQMPIGILFNAHIT